MCTAPIPTATALRIPRCDRDSNLGTTVFWSAPIAPTHSITMSGARVLVFLAVIALASAVPLKQSIPAAGDNVALPVGVTDPDQTDWGDSANLNGAPHQSQEGGDPADLNEDKTTAIPEDEDVNNPKGNSSNMDGGEDGDNEKPVDNSTNSDPCAEACVPDIDVEASVIESYQRLRAQVAVIGDYGTCKPGVAGNYTWTVDWGDKEQYIHTQDKIGPYQAERVYSAKKKRKVKVSFCSENPDGCDEGCSSFYKHIHVRP